MRRFTTLLTTLCLCLASCIEPPLHLPAEEVMIETPVVLTEMEAVWNLDVDWQTQWHYGWDMEDETRWGKIDYPEPTSFEVRRYYLGEAPGGPHTAGTTDGFTIQGNSFRRTFQFGYYDLLLWSNIDSPDGTQVLLVDDSNLDEVTATTTVTRGLTRSDSEEGHVTALYNQPEIFYSTYPEDVYISRNFEDYDYFNEEEGVWVKRINATLQPLVYLYLVQVVLHHNNGRITGTSGDAALSAMASGTSVNTGHTHNTPCMVYFDTRMKRDVELEGETVDIIGGRLTTFGLCDMQPYWENTRAQYSGTRSELPNYLYVTLRFSNGVETTLSAPVTEQVQAQCHGGVITLHLDCNDIEVPHPDDPGEGNLFVPTVEDYEHVDYDIPL